MKILLDMNIPLKYSKLLKEKGIDAVRWSDVGACNADDFEIMSYAQENSYIILTSDLDFGVILSTTHDQKPSIVQIRASVIHAERAVDLIVTAIQKTAKDLKKGAILSINLKKARLRILPL